MAERQFGPYRLVRQIAVGGMAEIHLAKTKGIAGFEKYVALKMIHPNFAEDEQFIEMLVDEAKIAVQLTHGNIAQTFDLGRVGETYYITMEFVDGADLYKVLRRGSEMDMDVPLDVCAFVGKEVAGALDYAHRKRDHGGKSLGIVHRDVSPQNVLLSHAGEVKLVDFGIAKATMKARQTAVGVIKGKYYYMSPEQAWGDPIDHRSDIFSTGIVLYEMITGQMLYLEEDLQKLLDMARKADIAPPSRLRKGVPPQLERIVMHALAKKPAERYQSAQDLASDLERFLHAYSPVFAASKISALLRQVLGDPAAAVEPDYAVDMRDGPQATMSLDADLLAHDKAEIRDENSVIFRLDGLAGRPEPEAKAPVPPAPAPPVARPGAPAAAPARARSPSVSPPLKPGKPPSLPRVPKPTTMPPPLSTQIGPPPGESRARPPTEPQEQPQPPTVPPPMRARPATLPPPVPGSPAAAAAAKSPAKRQPDETTREISTPAVLAGWAAIEAEAPDDDMLENIAERTMISAPSGMGGAAAGYMTSDADDDLENIGDRTVITTAPVAHDADPDLTEQPTGLMVSTNSDAGFEEVPTSARDFSAQPPPPRRVTAQRASAQAPPALAANIHAPAVSELRKPRSSRRTPSGGTAVQANVLQAIVGRSGGSEPMPSPAKRPTGAPPPELQPTMTAPQPSIASGLSAPSLPGVPVAGTGMPPSGPLSQSYPAQQPTQLAMQSPMQIPTPMLPTPLYAGYQEQPQPQIDPYTGQPLQPMPPVAHMPYAQPYAPNQVGGPLQMMHTPAPGAPGGYDPRVPPGMQPHLAPYAMNPSAGYGQPPPAYGQPPPAPYGQQPYAYPQVSHDGHYPFHPYGQTPVPTLSTQLRAIELEEIGPQYKLSSSGPRWAILAMLGVVAVSVAAATTYFIIRNSREPAPTVAQITVKSSPSGASVLFDGKTLADKTPLVVSTDPGSHHEIRFELAKHKPHSESVDVPSDGREVSVVGTLEQITGQLEIDSNPGGAEIWINGEQRGRTPKTIPGLDMDSTRSVELRLKDYQPARQNLDWPDTGTIKLDLKLSR